MRNLFLGSAFSLVLMTGSALAQTSYSSTTTTSNPPAMAPVAPPPEGTLSTSETSKSIDANGTEVDSSKTTYGNANGAASDSTSTTITPPPPVTTTTTTQSSTNSN